MQKENEDNGLFALGLISKNLEEIGIETAIEKNENQEKEKQDAGSACLQFITNGMCNKKNIICILILEKREMMNY